MSNKFQLKRTTVSGRTPNTTNSSNTQFIDTGELAINLADGLLYSSNGSSLLMLAGQSTPIYDEYGNLITPTFAVVSALTSLPSSIVPLSSNVYNIGSTTFNYANGYFSNLNLGNTTVNTVISSSYITTTGNVNSNNATFTGTANAGSLNVGANVNLSTTGINVGNSTVNTVISSSSITTTGNVNSNNATFAGVVGSGNTTVTGFINVSSYATIGGTANVGSLNVGANVNLTTTSISVGNSSVNTEHTETTIKVNGKQAINGPAFSAYANNTAQNITSGSQQKVLFQTEEFDTNSNYANSRFTPTVAGYYQLNAEVRLDGSFGTGETMIVVWKNGSEHKRGWNASGVNWASSFGAMTVSTLVYANGTTDYFEIYAQQTSGGTMTVTAVGSPNITWFNGAMVRGA